MFQPLLRFFLSLTLALAPFASVAQAATDEQNAIYNVLRGYFLAATGRHAEAAVVLGEIGASRRDGEMLRDAVQAAIQGRDLNLAKKYAGVWARYGGGVTAKQTQAELFLLAGDFAQAEVVLSALMANDEQSAEDLFAQLSQIKAANVAVTMGERLFPENFEGRYYLAVLAVNAARYGIADAALNAAVRQDPARPAAYLLRALKAAHEAEDDTAAVPVLRRYVAAGCHNGARHCSLTAVLSAYGYYVQKNEMWRDVLNAEKAETNKWALNAGNLLEGWGLLEQAKEQYETVADNFFARLGLARIVNEQEGAPAALPFLLEAEVENEQEYVLRETTIAQLLRDSGDLPAAIQRLQQARNRVPGNFSLMYNHALHLTENKEREAGLKVLEELTRLFPDNADSWNALGYVMADLNVDVETAEQHIFRALQMRPNDPNIMDSMGWAHYRLGRLESALQFLRQAAALSDSAEIAAHLGEVLWELGRHEQARQIWKESAAAYPDNKVLNETLARYPAF